MAVPVVVRRITEAYRRRPTAQAWDRFLADPAEGLLDLQNAFEDLRQDHLPTAAGELVNRIERRRSELRDSERTILYRDFGAGAPGARRSAGQLAEGVASQRRVSDLVLASVPREWGLLLFQLIRRFRPGRLIELGSALGISAAYQAAALELNDLGHLFTLEGCPEMARQARDTIACIGSRRATVVQGRFQDTLAGVLERIGRIDFAFVDGHHDGLATLDYWQRISALLMPQSVVIFDDIDWSAGMRRAWKSLERDPVVSCSLDLGKFGCCLCLDPRLACTRHFELPGLPVIC